MVLYSEVMRASNEILTGRIGRPTSRNGMREFDRHGREDENAQSTGMPSIMAIANDQDVFIGGR